MHDFHEDDFFPDEEPDKGKTVVIPKESAPPGHALLAKAGEGAMGEVYRARELALDRIVALKLIKAQEQIHERRFIREAHVMARLVHPHIAPIFHFGEWNGRLYLTMPFIENNLKKVLSKTPLSISSALAMLKQLAEALHSAHEAGIVHRDLKPENILVDRQGSPIIADFGLAVDHHGPDLTQSSSHLGTPLYMSPEQARGQAKNLESPADIFSLGIIFYQMVSGRLPFSGKDRFELLENIIRLEPVPLTEILPDIPENVCRICRTMLEKEPERRCNASALLEMISEINRIDAPGPKKHEKNKTLPSVEIALLKREQKSWLRKAALADNVGSIRNAELKAEAIARKIERLENIHE